MMLRFSRFYFLSVYFFAFLTAPAVAHTDEARLPYVGQPSQLPAETTTQFLQNHSDTEGGRIDYKASPILQRNLQQWKKSERDSATIGQDAFLDDTSTRQKIQWEFKLHLNPEERWQIDTVKKDKPYSRIEREHQRIKKTICSVYLDIWSRAKCESERQTK